MNRRRFVQTAISGGVGLRIRTSPAAVPGRRKPNIVFVQTDSWDGRVLGCLKHAAVKSATPNIDGLAAQGTVFRNAYCTHPVCCPSRANMWSGRYTHHVESWNNFKGLSTADRTFKQSLESAGYQFASQLGGIGKHDYLSGAHSVFNRLTDWTGPANIQLPQLHMRAPLIVRDGENPHGTDWRKVEDSLTFLRSAAKGDKPFFLYVGLSIPHPSFTTSPKWLNRIDRRAVTVPPPDDELHPVMAYQRVAKNWEHGFADGMVLKARAIYYAMCSEGDAMVGAVADAVDRLGIAGNTYFIFTSDHGENNMEHRQFYKMNMYESSARVPLVIAGPGVRKGAVVDSVVSLIDIFPTLMDMAGVPQPAGLDGESLMPLLTGTRATGRDWAHAMYTGFSCNTTMYMLRRGDWKYVAYPGYGPQLFNLRDDPDEVKNLAAARKDMVKEMDTRLMDILDYHEVHRRVIAYDKSSFRAWRAAVKRKPTPMHEYGMDTDAATYEQVMANCYSGWNAEHERQLERWLAAPPA
jgi:arylsulfatase K